MKKIFSMILIGIIIMCFTISIGFLPVADNINIIYRTEYSENSIVIYSVIEEDIFKEIEEIDNKNLVINKIIGDVHVKFWEHEINGVIVKNDYILLHLSLENKEILKYEKKWRDIPLKKCLDPLETYHKKYFWKQVVAFLEVDDLSDFYKLDAYQKYPIVCWEIRYFDGSTVLYDLQGNSIGLGVQAPVEGFSLSGYHNESWPDPWNRYKENADFWFSKWCDTTNNISLPEPMTISSYVSNPNVMYFFEMAHGNEFNFQADSVGSLYFSLMVRNDMVERPPMKFAFIGSCHGMTTTDPGTFSYEFRKGQMSNTVTVGFDHMENCPGWQYGFPWQNSMFENMSRGMTIKNAFDMATARYPTISPAVVFLGDQNLVVNLPPYIPSKPVGPTSGHIGTIYTFSTSVIDPNNDSFKYGWDWNGDNIVDEWDDNNSNYYPSGVTVNASHSWHTKGTYSVKVKAENSNGVESDWSDPLVVSMPKNKPLYRFPLFLRFLDQHPRLFPIIRQLLRL